MPSSLRCFETWSLAAEYFIGFSGQGADITIFEKNTSEIIVFEGFMDFLTYLEAKKITEPLVTVTVLNSVLFVGRLVSYIETNGIIEVGYFRDRDVAGKKFLEKLVDKCPSVFFNDKSEHYKNFKDLNERWVSKNSSKKPF